MGRVMPHDLLVIGHICQDSDPLAPEGWRLGGTAAYAAALAANLGLSTAILTSAAPDLPLAETFPSAALAVVPAPASTRFENTYHEGRREQRVLTLATRIARPSIPEAWRCIPTVLLAPIIDDVDPEVAAAFPRSLIALCLQGWLRYRDESGRVHPVCLHRVEATVLHSGAHALFLSEEDIRDDPAAVPALQRWSAQGPGAPIVVLTRGQRGAQIWQHGACRSLPAFRVTEVDPTGAGDIFATAFLIRYVESGSVPAAATFAAAAAALSVTGPGLTAVPDRPAIERLINEQPEVRLT
jgi:hypothetical protein